MMKLKFIGKDSWSRPVYEDENGKLWKDVEMNSVHLGKGEKVNKYALCSSVNNAFDGEPNIPMGYSKSYDDVEIVLVFDEAEKPVVNEFDYMLLSRLQSDCDYYLGYGNRCEKYLWAGNVEGQIEKMKDLHNGFAYDQKPEWLTYDDILNYEKEIKKEI